CVQCGFAGEKRLLLRIAGRAGGEWSPDPKGILPGRGIYLCRKAGCIERFSRRIRTEKGGARWKMGRSGIDLAERLTALWAAEVKKAGGLDGEGTGSGSGQGTGHGNEQGDPGVS
ncbi:MAG TPA: YlxR family protein, partial [Candidatus Deferrimicrobiaceae bacterium]